MNQPTAPPRILKPHRLIWRIPRTDVHAMSKPRRKIGRRELVQIAILGTLMVFGGCSDQTIQEKRKSKAQMRNWCADTEFRRKLPSRVRKGDKAMPSEKPGMKINRRRL